MSKGTRRSGFVSLMFGFCAAGCLGHTDDPNAGPSSAATPSAVPIPSIQQPEPGLVSSVAPTATPCGFADGSKPQFAPPPMQGDAFFPGGGLGSHLGSTTERAAVPPPAISGGTLLATHDGKQLVASDPDRDLIYVVDIASHALVRTHQFEPGDEPGRLVEDAAGRIHVALRGGHAIATLTRDDKTPATRRGVCDLPRGLAYDATADALHVACAEGTLVSLGAAPDAAITRSVPIGRDARDVIARGEQLFVTHFRSAELLTLDASGTTMQTRTPPTFSTTETSFSEPTMSADGSCGNITPFKNITVRNTPTVAWRALDIPGRGVAMLHQRAREAEVQVSPGGYGLGNCGSGIVQTSITVGVDQAKVVSADMAELALAVDMAVDPDGVLLAIVAPGNWGVTPQVQMFKLNGSSVLNQAMTGMGKPGDANAKVISPDAGNNPCVSADTMFEDIPGQATAVAFISPYMLAVQQREPAAISFMDIRTGVVSTNLDLQQASRFDTGHEMFHMRAGAGVACASCHAEGGDDGHVWTFHGIGARRTQSLRGGILGTEPFHWNGDMRDFPTLVREVFVGRMAGFQPLTEQTDALAHWIDRQPEFKTQLHDVSAVERGKQLFESDATQCASCHSGAMFTNNKAVDVGTGAEFQVPALRGVSFRTPLMHDGCAKTLADRFGACGGGDKHGRTSQLKPNELADLVSYLETL